MHEDKDDAKSDEEWPVPSESASKNTSASAGSSKHMPKWKRSAGGQADAKRKKKEEQQYKVQTSTNDENVYPLFTEDIKEEIHALGHGHFQRSEDGWTCVKGVMDSGASKSVALPSRI